MAYSLPFPRNHWPGEYKRHLIYRDIMATYEGLTAVIGGHRVNVYGGLLAENLTQGSARDVLADAWLRCADAGYTPVLTVHDQLLFEVPEAIAEDAMEEIRHIMEQPVSWAPGLPVGTEAFITPIYCK